MTEKRDGNNGHRNGRNHKSIGTRRRPAIANSPSGGKVADPKARSKRSAAHNKDQQVHDARPARAPARNLYVVGLGASAGGLEALQTFFSHMPHNTGMSFIVVTHLAKDRTSLMPELLARATDIPVKPIASGMAVEPNTVYVVPPGHNLGILQGVLTLLEPNRLPTSPLPIDFFFRSLAQDQREMAIGIVLSGTGSDGTLGLKEIKGEGGMAMVQAEHSAKYTGMPHSAITGDNVDYVLPVERMPRHLIAYISGRAKVRPMGEAKKHNEVMRKIFLLLRARTGHDFSLYKSSTIMRRIERRMNVHHVPSAKEYLRFLEAKPNETSLLFKELLINVTSFFRDDEAYATLAKDVLPAMLEKKPDGYVIRIWTTGCASGEEAYSLAILLREVMDKLKRNFAVQIFATDLDSGAIDLARTGFYPEGISADVSPERLERFFNKEDSGYRVKKDIREMVVFAPQNLIEDPPFTKLDLLACRNLLIYLEPELQKRVMPIFHYALKPGGVLFLGSSESVGSYTNLFTSIDKKWKIYRRIEVEPGSYNVEFPANLNHEHRGAGLAVAHAGHFSSEGVTAPAAERLILAKMLPPTVIVHERGEIVHIHGRTGLFLEPAPGPQVGNNIFNMAREGLQIELSAAFRQAGATNQEVVHRGVRVRANGHHVLVDIHVQRLAEPEQFRGLFLVSFLHVAESAQVKAGDGKARAKTATSARIDELERELQYTRESRQSTVEELETANEELKSTNEELQSTNEELQSTNEELETSKEEMQSLNEELQTVNAELAGKVDELSRTNDDMKNLLNGTDIATIFLDSDLNIKRYTEQAKKVIRVIRTDIGRRIDDLVSRLEYGHMVADAREVLRTLIPKETEARSDDNTWYLVRIVPYRTTENAIEGLVMTFVDISKTKNLQENQMELQLALEKSPFAIFGQDKALKYIWAYGRSMLGHLPKDVLGKGDDDLLPTARAGKLIALKRKVLKTGKALREAIHIRIANEPAATSLYLHPMWDKNGRVVGVMSVTSSEEQLEGKK